MTRWGSRARRAFAALVLSWVGAAQAGVVAEVARPAPTRSQPASAGADASRGALRPLVECVVENGPGSFTAHFGFLNEGSTTLSLPVGSPNVLAPGPEERGQPRSFAPGRSKRFPDSAFRVDFDGRDLVWTLVGPDGRARTATASASSRRCAAVTDTDAPRLFVRTPAGGAFLATRHPRLELSYEDDGALDLASLRVTIDGVDRTAWFSVGPGQAVTEGKPEHALEEGRHRLEASIRDDAGRTGSVAVPFTIDTVPPQLSVLRPADGAVESGTRLDVSGGVVDETPVTVTVAGLNAVVKDRAFRAVGVPLGAGPEQALPLMARDAAGNTATASVRLRIERRPPVIRITSPGRDEQVAGPSVRVTGTVRGAEGTDVKAAEGQAAPPSVTVEVNGQPAVVEGGTFRVELPAKAGSLTLRAVARSASGLLATDSVTVTVDTVAPELTVESPKPGTATKERSLRVSGRVDDPAAAVRINGALAKVDAGRFTGTVALAEEGDQTILVAARDAAGNRREIEIPVRVDRTGPSLRMLSLPEGAPVDGRAVSVAGATEDSGAVSVTVNGQPAERLERGWRVDLAKLPSGKHVLEVVARDEAGNETRVKRTVTVSAPSGPMVVAPTGGPLRPATPSSARGLAAAAQALAETAAAGEGALVGQVLSDLTGLPVAEAAVRLTPGGQVMNTDEAGRFRFTTAAGPVILSVEKDGAISIDREVSVEVGLGSVVIDARLRPRAAPASIDAAGGALHAQFPRRLRPADPGTTPPSPAALTLTLPPGSVAGAHTFHLTALSPQALPGLLPLGYSPILAIDFQGTTPPASTLAHVTGLPALTLHLVAYDTDLHAWTLVDSPLQPADGTLDFTVAGLGAWSLVAVDPSDPPLSLPAPGGPLVAAPFAAIPEGATSRSFADPPSLPASGGTSHGRLEVDSPQPLPSGTVVQAVLNESFRLVSGESSTGEERLEDILLYRADLDGFVVPETGSTSVAAEIPIVASRQFSPAELEDGRVHLRILAGRERVRATGGSNAVTVTSGGVSLKVAAGALPEDTAVSMLRAPSVSPFIPLPPGETAVAEVVVDLSGATLALAAELELPATGVPPGGSLFVARVELVGGETRLQVVAWAERDGDKVVTRVRPPLPGLRQGGRYIVYHAAHAVGFLAGITRAAGQPTPALVTTSRLPFVGISGTDGAYCVLTQAGSVRASARVLGTALVGSVDAEVAAGSVRALDIELSQAITLAVVTPASGATGVPVTRQIELAATAPLDPATTTAASVSLRRTSDGALPSLRTVLSADARHLAVIPQAPLAYLTSYTFESAGGLRDVFGNPVAVPVVEFTTQGQTTETLNLDALIFSYPVDGMVKMRAPAGALPAGTQILVLNASNGSALSYTVGGLAVEAELRASIEDRLWVTVTDPQGNRTTFERTEYVAPDGKTAVGVAGGKVRGPDGSEMRLPPGVTDAPVTIKLASFPESALPEGQRPDLPDAHFAYGLAIESADKPRFKKEVDLAFPKPQDAPEGAFFYVYRKIDMPGGRVAFETIDQAFVEGGKVVTASFPFGGYQTSFGVLGGGPGQTALQGVSFNIALLMWTYDEILPGRAMAGVITGRVLRAGTDADTGELTYTPIPDAIVTGVNAAEYPLLYDLEANSVSTAISQGDGTFTMIDSRYTGGLIMVAAQTPEGESKTATAYQSNPLDSKNYGLRFFSNIARVTFTFDPLVPPPGPAVVDVTLVRIGDLGQRLLADSLVVEGSRLLVGIRRKNAEVEQVVIGGQNAAFRDDTLPSSEPLAFDVVTSDEFVASPPGMYRVLVTARDSSGGSRTVARNFRVVPLGGGNELPQPGERPEVLDGRTYPAPAAKGVAVTALPQVEFSEPVRNVPGNVRLVEIDENGTQTPLEIRLLGVPPGAQTAVDVTPPAQAGQPIVSLIVRAMPGLRFDKRYRLELKDAIRDLDTVVDGGPRPLVPYSTEFATESLGAATSRESFPSAGVAVRDGYAYLLEDAFVRGTLKVYDVRQPSVPTPVPSADRHLDNRPVDVASRPRRLVVGTSVAARSVPSNLHVFDISRPDDPLWVGVASVSNGVLDGVLKRVVVHGSYAYGLVNRKGIQVVHVPQAEANFAATGGPTSAAYWRMRMLLNTDGQGFGQDAVVATIPLPVNTQFWWQLHDLDVGDYVLDNRAQPLTFVGAEDRRAQSCSLLAGSPLTAAIVSRTNLRTVDGQDLCPVLVALGRVAGRDVAVLGVGLGTLSYNAEVWGLAVVDVADPRSPTLLGLTRLGLPDLSDLVLDGETALVASSTSGTEVVNLGAPESPYVAGHIDNLSGRLATGEDGAYFSSGGRFQNGPEGGLHVFTPDARCNLLDLRDEKLMLEVVRDPVDGTLCGSGDVLVFNVCKASHVTLRIDGRAESLSVDGQPASPVADLPLAAGWHVVNVPYGSIGAGLDTVKPFTLQARSQADAAETAERQGTIQNKLLNRPVLPVGRTFVKGVDLFDGHVVRQSTDMKIDGRHLGLEVTRTYSSAARGEDGTLGAGWGWNYAAAVSPMSCGLYNVSTADGGGQVFRSGDGGQTFTPQRGYHGKLNRLPDTGYEFIDKAGVRHYFREPVDPAEPDGARRLDRTVEPHGDRVEVAYDLLGRVSSVREVLRGERPVRWLDARYVRVNGHDRVASVESNLGHRMEYGYDAEGNLTSVKRSGQNVDGGPDAEPATESYEYDTGNPRDPFQMTAAVGPNGERTEYAYYKASDSLPGEAAALSWIVSSKEELARQVTEFANDGPAPKPETKLAYDFSQAASSTYTTTVADPRGNDTVYTLNHHGSPTRIVEPLGKETLIGWKPDDVLKQNERDAEGRLTHYGYDERGNLTLERIEKDRQVLAETSYEYDPQFNKLAYKKDPQGRETKHTIDASTGDLLVTLDAVGNRTVFHYDPDGRLDWTKDPRGFTTHFRAFNDFGSPGEIENPLGQVTFRTYDARNRLVEERQEPYGRIARATYDGFDRPVELTRVSGGPASGDEKALTEYYPGGQPRATVNPLGARTEYALDGMNRVARTSVVVGEETLTTGAQYDSNGNRVFEKDRRGVARRGTYDALNRLRKLEVESSPNGEGPLGQVAAATYDKVGNKLTETDVNGLVTGFEYNGLYHLLRKVLPVLKAGGGNYEEQYRHDKVGNLERFTDANGKVTETEYDGLNRVTKVTRDAGGLALVTRTSYADPEGSHLNKSEDHDPVKGLRTSYTYDTLSRELTRTVRLEGEDGDAGPVVTYATTTAYEDQDHAVRVTDPRGVVSLRKLDGLDRVIEEAVDTTGLAQAPPLHLTTTIRYDGMGNKKEVRDPEDRPTLLDYDVLGRLLKTTDARGQETTSTYFGDGLKASETDRRGVKKLFGYDNLGRPRTTRLASAPFSGVGFSQETRYVDGAQPKRIEIDARGKGTTFDLDGLGRPLKEADPLGHHRTFTWDGVNKIGETDKRGFNTSYEYDGINRLTKVTDPAPFNGQTVVTTYQDALNRITEKDRRGFQKVTQLDPLGRVVSVTRAAGTADEAVLERNTYDANGNKDSQTDAEGKVTRFVYDAANRLSARTNGFGTAEEANTTYVYDRVGNLLEERDGRTAALGEPWSVKNTYDDLNRLETETDSEGNLTRFGWDAEGNRTSIQAPKGQTTQYDYDELGKPTKVTQPPPAADQPPPVTAYGYDENRNRTRQTDANGNVVAMEYDDLNRLKKTTQDPGGLSLVSETTRFDDDGNPEVVVDPKGQTTTSTFDELNRLKTKDHSFAPSDPVRPWRYTKEMAYAYDANGNLERVDEFVASGPDPPATTLTTLREHDGLDRMIRETAPLPDGSTRTVSYGYYRNGARKTVTDHEGSVTLYTYDGQNRLQSAETDSGRAEAKTTTYGYWPDDLLRTVAYPNGLTATHSYDKADRLLSLVNARGGTVISSYEYSGTHPTTGQAVSYDGNGNRLIQVETNGGRVEKTAYGYDDLDRLATVMYPADDSYPQGRVVTYGYDPVGNRTLETEKDSTGAVLAEKEGSFDKVNRLTALRERLAPANDTAFTWDPNGNQIAKTTGGVTTEYRYEPRDKLVEVVQGASTLGRYQYDVEGRRTLKIGEEGLRQYVYDDTSLLAEYDQEGNRRAKYDYGSDRLISLTRSDEGRRYFSLDGLRSVVNLTDDSGTPVASYHLDAWGTFRFPTELDASRNRFGFTGHLFDTETGLYNAKARYFDPELGRFLSQDSYLGQIDEPPSLHRYSYAHNNPAAFVDPTGHYVESVIEIASIGVGIYSLKQNYEAGNWWGMAGDVLGIAVDAVALAIPVVPGGVGLAIKSSRAYKAAEAVDLANNIGQGIAGTAQSYAEGKGWRALLQGTLTALGLGKASRLTNELATDISKLNANLSEAQKAAKVAEAPTADAAAPVPGAKVDPGTRPVADAAAPPPPARQPHAAPGDGGGARRSVDDGPPRGGDGPGGTPGRAPERAIPCRCFTAETKVATSEGEKAIESLEVGDEVWARDTVTGEGRLSPVTRLFRRVATEIVVLSLAAASIQTTPEHPFWVRGEGWVPAADLRVGDQVSTLEGEARLVQGIERRTGEWLVYNFEVEGPHNYFVSNARILVHNNPCDLTPPKKGAAGRADDAEALRASPESYHSYAELHKRIKASGLSGRGKGLEAHHLLEKRFAGAVGVDPNAIISVPLTPRWHRNMMGEGANLNDRIVKELRKAGVSPAAATLQQIWEAHRNVYARLGQSDWAMAIYKAYFEGKGIDY